jgi:Cellulose biosynthesis protein BcsS
MGLRIFAPCLLVSIGAALAEDSPPNAAETPRVIESQFNSVSDSDVYSVGITPAQDSPSPIAAQRPITSEPRYPAISDSLDAYSIGITSAQSQSPPTAARPIAVAPPIIPQHIAVSSYVDADSLGNRTVYADGTFAPFGGIYESGVRFRVMGDASWYRFITSENPRTLGTGRYLEGDFLIGYGLWLTGFNVTGLVGPAFAQIDNLGAITDRWGVKASIEMNAKPTDWMIASGSVTYSTVTNNLQVQAKAGFKISEGVYVGPESKFQWQQILPVQISFFTPSFTTATPVSPQTNIAYMHLGAFSALNIGPVVVGLSGGWAQDRQLGSGYYGSASLYVPF